VRDKEEIAAVDDKIVYNCTILSQPAVMKKFVYLLLLGRAMTVQAQTDRDLLVGEWKSYLPDSITFEYLQLNKDGSGLKCYGKTYNGEDSLFRKHVSTHPIADWRIEKNKLIIASNLERIGLSGEYEVKISGDSITLTGGNVLLGNMPSILNKELHTRSVTYQRASKFGKEYGVKTARCVMQQRLFTFQPIDKKLQLAKYIGFGDLIPHLEGCRTEFSFAKSFADPAYSIKIPASVKGWSFGYGNLNYYVRFDTPSGDKPEMTIVIYYDFRDEMKDHYLLRLKTGKEKGEMVTVNGRQIYKGINWEEKFEGKIFLENRIVIAYYTGDDKMQKMLQDCITSFKYE
jgi:hypothetical protein